MFSRSLVLACFSHCARAEFDSHAVVEDPTDKHVLSVLLLAMSPPPASSQPPFDRGTSWDTMPDVNRRFAQASRPYGDTQGMGDYGRAPPPHQGHVRAPPPPQGMGYNDYAGGFRAGGVNNYNQFPDTGARNSIHDHEPAGARAGGRHFYNQPHGGPPGDMNYHNQPRGGPPLNNNPYSQSRGVPSGGGNYYDQHRDAGAGRNYGQPSGHYNDARGGGYYVEPNRMGPTRDPRIPNPQNYGPPGGYQGRVGEGSYSNGPALGGTTGRHNNAQSWDLRGNYQQPPGARGYDRGYDQPPGASGHYDQSPGFRGSYNQPQIPGVGQRSYPQGPQGVRGGEMNYHYDRANMGQTGRMDYNRYPQDVNQGYGQTYAPDHRHMGHTMQNNQGLSGTTGHDHWAAYGHRPLAQ